MLVKNLAPDPGGKALLLGLLGDLGSGKTTFVKCVGRALGISETITSPTFIIEKIYKIDHSHFDHVIHIDAYRLEEPAELVHLGWQEIIDNPKNIILLEWPEKVLSILPESTSTINFKFINENEREIAIPDNLITNA